jgi:tRNA pseudouridine38-40 synthase
VLQRYRATIEYDGTDYRGFQRQRQGPTIQAALEQALASLARRSVRVIGAGRTDSGVHALGQVISFDLNWPAKHGSAALQRALNANLPEDIVVLQLTEAQPGFHPRFDARQRTYRYLICNVPVRRPLCRRRCWQVSPRLDVDRMNQAAALLVGTHDFATFGRPPKGENTVRQVYRARWQGEGEQLRFEITANAFLQRMVRSLVGSLKEVGTGKWTVEQFAAAFEARQRACSATAAPPQGLYLVSVSYDDQ